MILPVTYELDEHGEGNGSAHPYCSVECQRFGLPLVPFPYHCEAEGGEDIGDERTVCEGCGKNLHDPRLYCMFCWTNHGSPEPATVVAPQHTGGDTDKPAAWVPVCDTHFENWYDDVDADERLPAFRLVPDPVVLTLAEAQAVDAMISYRIDHDEDVEADDIAAADAIASGINRLES